MAPSTNPASGARRLPSAPVTTTSAPSAERQASQSAAGSALARLPPMVPRVRTAR